MAFTDNTQVFTTLDNILARYYDMGETRYHYHRLGDTAKWFSPRVKKMRGKSLNTVAIINPSSASRIVNYGSARTAEFPIARDMKSQPLSITYDDMRELMGSVKVNDHDIDKTTDPEMAAANLADKVISELDADFSSQTNAKLFQNSYGHICKASAIYDADGTTFTGAAGHASAFVQIKDGPIAAINRGDVLDIYDSASTGGSDTNNIRVVVHDVYYGKDGPPSGGSVEEVGPGILCEPCAADGSTTTGTGYDTAWNAVGTPADGDFIARSGEFSTDSTAYNNFHGLPDWFDTTVDCYRNESGTLLDREAAGNAWMNPFTKDYQSGGADVTFDVETHFRDAEDTLPHRIKMARVVREGTLSDSEEGAVLPSTLVAVGAPDLINEACRDADGLQRFTSSMAMSLDEAKRRELYGEVGFDGIVYHSPTLGVVSFQADIACPQHRLYITDPQSFAYVQPHGDGGGITWVEESGKRWLRVTGTNGRLTHYKQAAAYARMCLWCDMPESNFLITGVKSSNE